MTASRLIVVLCGCVFAFGLTANAAPPSLLSNSSIRSADAVATYKVVMSKSDTTQTQTVYVQAKSTDEAKQIAISQNPGWQVVSVTQANN
jgi:hypothetical protein